MELKVFNSAVGNNFVHGVSLRLNYFKLLQFIKMMKDKNHKESKKYLSSLTAKMIMIKINRFIIIKIIIPLCQLI